MSLYRTDGGEQLLLDWCQDRVETGPWEVTRSLDTSLASTHLAMVGDGSPSVLWLPGTNFNAATSATLAGLVGRHTRFCVADLPGQPGLSASAELGRDRLVSYGRWMNEVIEELDDEQVIVAGHSLGAAVALSASPVPAIRGLVLVNPAGVARVRITPRLLAVSLRWMLRPAPASATALVRYMQHPASPIDGALVDWLALVARHTRQVGSPGPMSDDRLHRWRSHARVLAGAEDAFFPPKRLRSGSAAHLGATVEVVDGAGHLLPDEQPERVLNVLLDLMGRLD